MAHTRDLFRLAFEQFSRWDFEFYRTHYINRLPYRFLESALAVNPGLEGCSGFDELREVVASGDQPGSTNPELFPYFNDLMIPGSSSLQSAVNSLRVHVGISPLDCTIQPHKRFWRLRHDVPVVLETVTEGFREVEGVTWNLAEAAPSPVVYNPVPHLFDDIEPRFYSVDSSREAVDHRSPLRAAFRHVEQFSSDLASGIRERIWTIALMHNSRDARSFSVRNFYIGGIFVSLANPIRLGEQLIHEYYHQSIWPWWLVEPPADLPSMDDKIVSPVTGRERPVPTMVHAFLIYCSLIEYYTFVLSASGSCSPDGTEGDDARGRLRTLESKIDSLYNALRTALHDRPSTAALLEFIAEAGRPGIVSHSS